MKDSVSKRVFDEVERRKWTDAEFARQIGGGADRQHITNWRKRGFPRARYPRVAELFGWTLDELHGNEPIKQRDNKISEPEPNRYDVLVGKDASMFFSEFKKLPGSLQVQVSQLVHLMVGELRRDEAAQRKGAGKRASRSGDRPNA
jgi:hypothetical protein